MHRIPTSPLFPYTTLFRSEVACEHAFILSIDKAAVTHGEHRVGLAIQPALILHLDRQNTRLHSKHTVNTYPVVIVKSTLRVQQAGHNGIASHRTVGACAAA